MGYILSIDQGTTGTTSLLISENLEVINRVNIEFKQIYPKSGWVEHNPNDIWESVEKSVSKLIKLTNIDPKEIKGIGITNQRETVTIWDKKSGKEYYNFIVWQDRRTANMCKELKDKNHEDWISKKTGLLLDPYFSGTKISWILKNIPNIDIKNSIAGTIDTYLVYRLTDKKTHITDVTNGSRTLLMDINSLNWDNKILDLLNIPKNILPAIKSSSEIYGYTKNLSFLPDGIPIASVAGDQQAALFGQTCFSAGESKCTYGTGSFILMNTGEKPIFSKNKLLTTIACKIKDKTTYALEGSVFIAGALIQWLRDELQIIKTAPEITDLAQKVETSEGVTILPAFTGLGAPYWKPNVKGLIYGLTRGTNRYHIARAALEAIALQNYNLLERMENDSGIKLKSLKVDGGASVNDILMQFQSNLLGVDLFRPKSFDTTSMGVAMLAALAVGIFDNIEQIRELWKVDKTYTPKDSLYTKKVLNNWDNVINMVLK